MIRRNESGMMGGIEAVILGVLVLVIGTLVVINAWVVIDTKLAVTAAAREASRAYVEASRQEDAESLARQSAQATMIGHGKSTNKLQVRFVGNGFKRCALVTMETRYPVKLAYIPLIPRSALSLTIVGRHSEIVDPFRSGIEGEVDCED